jgi:ribose 5-phosphate isomerase B
MKMKLFIASDHAGFETKNAIKSFFSSNFDVIDLGASTPDRTDYTNFAHKLSSFIENDPEKCFGILICGSGIGVSIVANRYKSVRAALIYNEKIAELSRQHNDANVACFGARFFSANEITKMAEIFLTTEFMGGVYLERVNNMNGR